MRRLHWLMMNNDRLLIVQKAFKIRADKVAEVCCCTRDTVYTWRKVVDGQFYRNMPNAAWSLLASHIVSEGHSASLEELNRLIDSEYKGE